MKKKKRILFARNFAAGILLCAVLSWVFYRSFFPVIAMLPLAFLFARRAGIAARAKADRRFQAQFKDAIISISAALSTGYSLENAIGESEKEMNLIYGKKSEICAELARMNSGIRLNIPVETLFLRLARRKNIDDVSTFAQIVSTAKRTGGNMTAIIKKTADSIGEKAETEREIEVMISQKRMEQRIMCAVPVLMIVYISRTSPDFFSMMYTSLAGRAVMTVCLAAYAAAYFISERIVDIEV